MEVEILTHETTLFLRRCGYMKRSWDYPRWNGIKYAASEHLKRWRHAKKYLSDENHIKRLAMKTILMQPWSGVGPEWVEKNV